MSKRFDSKIYYIYGFLACAYVATFLTPRPIGALEQLSTGQYRLFSLSLILPMLGIWFAAFYGYLKLRRYAELITDSADGKHVGLIATGLLILAIGLPVSAITNGINGIISVQYPGLVPLSVVIRDYVILLAPLAGILFISRGAHGLGEITGRRASWRASLALSVGFVVLAVFYCYVTLSSPSLQATYHLDDWAIAATIVLPCLITWLIGFQAAYEIHRYGKLAPGSIYRRNWNLLASGITATVIMQIVVQYTTTVTIQLASLRMWRLFITVYVLLAAMSIGFLLVAYGAKRLQRIEEV